MSQYNSDNERSGYTTPTYSEYAMYEDRDENPTSQTIIDLMNKFNRLLSKKEIHKFIKDDPALTAFDITHVAQEIQDQKNYEKENQKQEHKILIEEHGKYMEKQLRDRKLQNSALLIRYSPPKNFSPVDTLHDSQRSSTASRMFPRDKQKFDGTANSPALSEFLSNMEVAQNTCRLSEKEFKERLLSCTSGNVHEFIYNMIKLDYSLEHIYNSLENMFDNTPSVGNAKLCLYHFKAPKTFTFSHVVIQIQWLATIASNSSPSKEVNKSTLSIEACNALIRSMPAKSSEKIEEEYRKYLRNFCRDTNMPDFAEFVCTLSSSKALFDRDITENGCEESQMYGGLQLSTSIKRNTSKFLLNGDYLLNSNTVKSTNRYPKVKTRKSSGSTRRKSYSRRTVHAINYKPSQQRAIGADSRRLRRSKRNLRRNLHKKRRTTTASRRSPRNHQRRFGNRRNKLARHQKSNRNGRSTKHCLLCNETSHNAHESCKFMRSPDGQRIETLPSQAECAQCAQQFNIRVFHKPALCPLKRNDQTYIKLKQQAKKNNTSQ